MEKKAKTYGIKYIGSKDKLNKFIMDLLDDEKIEVNTLIDAFTGTTRVAQAFRFIYEIPVITSDIAYASDAYAHTFVHNKDNRHLASHIKDLNNLEPQSDWLTETYCDVRSKEGDNIVRVWQPHNGEKADAIRNYIETLELEHWEKMTLITALIFALQKVDNTVGIQQAYLKNWEPCTYNQLELELPPMLWKWNPIMPVKDLPVGKHFIGDTLKIEYPFVDLAYLDPPYTIHQYQTYYHIWDSIVKWDKPEVGLKTNRRKDRINMDAKQWNSVKTAKQAFFDVVKHMPAKHIMISYSDDGLIPIEDIKDVANQLGTIIDLKLIDYKRNAMSSMGNMSDDLRIKRKNVEYLLLMEK